MTQAEVEAWIAAQGGPSAVQHTNDNKTMPNPAKTGLKAGDSSILDTITVNTQTWTNPKTGAILSVIPKGGGQYEVDTIRGGDPSKATGTGTAAQAGTPAQVADAEAQAAQDLSEKKANQARAADDNPAYETNAVRETRLGKKASDADTKATRERTEARAAAGGGTISERPDGVYIIKPDGTTIKTDLPAKPAPSSHSTVKGDDGTTYVVTVDADGNVSTKVAIPAQSVGAPTPSSATSWRPDLSLPDLGMFDRRKALAEMLESGVFGDPASKQAQDKALELLKGDFELAKTTATNVGNIQQGETTIYSGGIRQREGDQTQANTRLSNATSLFNSTVAQVLKGSENAKTGEAVVGALKEMLNNARLYIEQFGGLRDYPRIEPGANQARTSDLFKPPTPGVTPTGPSAAPQAAPAAPGAEPFVPPPTGAPGGGTIPATQGPTAPAGAPDPWAPSPPPAPDAPVQLVPGMTGPQPGDFPATPPPAPTYYPGSEPGNSPGGQVPTVTDRATQAQQLFGVGQPAAPAAAPGLVPLTSPDPAQAAQAQALVGQRPPVTGGSLAWARQLGFPDDVIRAFMAIEGGQAA